MSPSGGALYLLLTIEAYPTHRVDRGSSAAVPSLARSRCPAGCEAASGALASWLGDSGSRGGDDSQNLIRSPRTRVNYQGDDSRLAKSHRMDPWRPSLRKSTLSPELSPDL